MEPAKKSRKRNKFQGAKPSTGDDQSGGVHEGIIDEVGLPPVLTDPNTIPSPASKSPPPVPSSALFIPENNNNKNISNKKKNRKGPGGGDKKQEEKGEGQAYDPNKVMERDSEYRRLNAKIKEQEYRMRQMELNAKSDRDLSDRIAKKVEEEVRQKLSKAMIMSSMYKAEEPTSSFPSRSSGAQEGGKRGGGGGGKKKGNERKSESDSGPQQTKKKDAKTSDIGQPQNQPLGSQNPRSQIRLPKDAAPFRHQHTAPTNSSSGGEPSEFEAQQLKLEAKLKEKERFFLQLESEVKKRIDEIRRDKSALQDFCLLGPGNGAPEYALKCNEFESLIMDKLTRGDLLEACQEKYCHKLTEMKLKQLGLFHAVLSSAMNNSEARTAKESLITKIASVFHSELSKTEMVFTTALQPLQKLFQRARVAKITQQPLALHLSSCPRDDSDGAGAKGDGTEIEVVTVLNESEERAVRSSLSNLLSSIGELRKYEITLQEFQKQSADWSQVITWYQEAVSMSPLDGTFYRPLAQISRSQGDAFQAAYYLSLSLMTDEPLATAREMLLDVFENSRLQAEQFPVVTALTRMSQQEHISHFQPHFLAAVGIAYSRTSADMFSHHMERCRRHLSTTLQLLTIDILHDLESGRGHKGDFTQFDQFGLLTSSSSASSMSAATAVGNEIFFSKASELSNLIRKTVVIIISLLESLSNKHHLKDFYHSVNWNHSYSTPSNPNANGNAHYHKSGGSSSGSSRRHVSAAPSAAVDLSLEEKLVFEKRYTIQCLHKVQCIPGFLDLARLLLGLIATLISSEGVGIGSRTGVSSHVNENKLVSTILLVTSCPAISLFFDWISEHPEFQIISVLDKTAWEQMESDLAVYLSTLAHWTLPKQISVENKHSAHEVPLKPSEFDAKGCLLEEDFVLQGFLPLRPLFQRRSDLFHKSFAALPHVVESLDLLKNGQGNTETESLSKICQPLPLLSSLSHSSRLVVHAHRCVDTVRTLCNQPVVFGHDANGIFFDKHRQTLYPSSPDSKFDHSLLPLDDIVTETTATGVPKPDPKHCLCVIVYKAPLMMRSAGFMSSGHGSKQSVILTEEEFLRGSTALTEELFLASSPQDHLEPSIEASPSEAPQSALQETEVLDLIEAEDTGEIFPEEFKPLEEERQKKEKSSTPVSLPFVTPLGEQQQQQHGKGVLRISAPSSMKRAPAAPPAPLSQKARQLKETAELPLIVIDTPNVAMRHGLNTKFSCRGIKLAIDFFHSAGHRVVAFLPDFYFNFERVGELRRSANLGISSVRASQIPDDVQLLQQLLGQGFLIGTPAQDYDDSYCLNYARQRGGYIISNDLYRDHLKRYESPAEREETRKWLKSHVISYTFVGDEFLPNPDASMK